MILVFIALVSLSVVYFTRLLSKKQMKAATIAIAVLYINIIVWTYAIFLLDVANLGFSDTETGISLLHGSEIYHSFVSITEKMSAIPLEILEAIVVVAAVALLAGFSVAFHGVFEITRAVIKAAKEKKISADFVDKYAKYAFDVSKRRQSSIIRLHCRMNC